MKNQHHTLLFLDGIINLALGILLLLAPFGMASFLGVPEPVSYLYPSVLGGVLLGIGISLILEAGGKLKSIHGLGMGGAIIINFCGAGTLLGWLLMTSIDLPIRGLVLLWSIVVVVMLVGVGELMARPWQA